MFDFEGYPCNHPTIQGKSFGEVSRETSFLPLRGNYMNSDIRKMTPLEAVAELRQFDHAFISEEGCKAFHFAFGQPEYGGQTYRASPNEPKGLTLKDGAKEAVGMDAYFVRRRRLKWLKRGLSLVAILAAIFVILHGV